MNEDGEQQRVWVEHRQRLPHKGRVSPSVLFPRPGSDTFTRRWTELAVHPM